MNIPSQLVAGLAMAGLLSWCSACSAAERYVRQSIPIELRSGKPVIVKIRSLSGNGWNEVGIRCSESAWRMLAGDKDNVVVQLKRSNKNGTKIANATPDDHKLWPVESFHYLFLIGGEYRADAIVEITFKNAPTESIRAE